MQYAGIWDSAKKKPVQCLGKGDGNVSGCTYTPRSFVYPPLQIIFGNLVLRKIVRLFLSESEEMPAIPGSATYSAMQSNKLEMLAELLVLGVADQLYPLGLEGDAAQNVQKCYTFESCGDYATFVLTTEQHLISVC